MKGPPGSNPAGPSCLTASQGGGGKPPPSAAIDRLDLAVGGAVVAGARTHQAVVVELLDDVGRPAGDARHREDRGIDVRLQVHVVIEARGGPVDVGRQLL